MVPSSQDKDKDSSPPLSDQERIRDQISVTTEPFDPEDEAEIKEEPAPKPKARGKKSNKLPLGTYIKRTPHGSELIVTDGFQVVRDGN